MRGGDYNLSAKIKGITISIGADTQPLNKALEDVNKKSRDLQGELRQVERLLKLDPSNTTLVAQKQRLLSEAVENTKSKLETLREAEKQVQQQFERGEIGEEQYRAIQREVIKTEQDLKKLENQLRETNNKWKETAEALDKFGKKTTEIGKEMTTKITAPIVGAATASMVAWKEVDDALDTIVTKTGATGEAMEGLEKSFRNVTKTLPAEIQAVGEAIGEVNTQFGFTGEKLEEATTLLLKFAQINGQDVTTATINSKEAIEAFGLSADNLNEVLDAVTRTAQNTGVSTDKLFDSVIKGAPQLKALELDFAQATALMGSFEQKGIDSSKALTYLSRAQVQFAKDGKTLEEGLTELVTKLQNTADETEALNIASEIFGTRGATFMLDAIQRGALDFEDFANAAKLAAGAVTETYEGTLDPVDQFTVAFNNLKLVGSDIAALLQEKLAPIIEKVVEILQKGADWFRNLSPEMQNAILVIGGLAAAIGPLLIIVGKIASGISAIMGLFSSFSAAAGGVAAATGGATAATGGLSAVIGALTGPIGIAIAAITGIIAIIVRLWNTNEEFRENVKQVWDQIKELFSLAMDAISNTVTTIFNAIKEFWEQNSEQIKGITDAIWNTIAGIFNSVLEIISGILDVFIGLFTGDWERFGQGLTKIWEGLWNGIQAIIDGVFNVIKNLVQIFINFVSSKWEGFGGLLQNVWNIVWNTVKTVIDSVLKIIRGIFDVFVGLFTGDWEKMGEGIKTIWQGMWDGIKAIVEGAWDLLKGAFRLLWDSISGWFSDLFESAVEWGKNLISGFIDGINSMISNVKDAVSGVIGTVKDYLGFSSPAKKGEGRFIEDWGYNMIEGFMDGMKKAIPQLQSTLNAAIPNMSSQNYTSSTFNTTNSFVVHAVIREENDIKKVAQELYRLQQQKDRGRGLVTI